MSRSTQSAGHAPLFPVLWDADPVPPHFHLRMVAWSLSLSSILWLAFIVTGHAIWKVWR